MKLRYYIGISFQNQYRILINTRYKNHQNLYHIINLLHKYALAKKGRNSSLLCSHTNRITETNSTHET